MYDIDKIVQLLGGARVLGTAVRTPLELRALLRRGLPTAALASLAAHLTPHATRVAAFVFKSREPTSSPSLANGLLSTEESDCVYRIANALAHAIDTLGGIAAARTWLTTPHAVFDGEAPLDLLNTDTGCEIVETALAWIDHGIAV